jgi:Mg2+ and Co2+ transporter CorA
MSNGHAFVVVGDIDDRFFTDEASGILGQFRHQHFLLGLIAHFHKAALLMLSDRLVVALARLDIHRAESIRRFKRDIRQTMEIFLRFTHRYWFHEVSDQAQTRDLFRMWSDHLGTDGLYAEVRQRIMDMAQYLDSDQLRRQAETVIRLTVVTTLGLIGTVSTGFLGMNLIAEADRPLAIKLLFFVLVFVPSTALVLYAVAKSKGLSEALETLSDERAAPGEKVRAFTSVWSGKRRGRHRKG